MVEIRKLPPGRWRDYRTLRLESLKGSPLAFGSAFEEEAKFGEGEWKQRMKDAHFAMEGEAPIGMVVLTVSSGAKFRHIAEIYSFYVRRSCRGRGVGTALLRHAIGLASSDGRLVKARLYVNSQQRTAIRMYEKNGFSVVGRLRNEMKVGSRFYSMLIMEKVLRRQKAEPGSSH